VDLRGGRCVRLYQGDYEKETVFSDDPVEVALEWQSMGAARLHIVDLDGAASGQPRNLDIIEEIASSLLIPTQLGGGIRSMETVEEVLRAGVERVILGTAAVEDSALVEEACRSYRERVVVGIDAREGHIATRGWRQQTGLETIAFAQSMAKLGVRRFIYTDINRDGTLTEPNFAAIFEMVKALRLPVIASGGISSVGQLKALKQLGVEGAIVGRALYTSDISLKQAMAEINRM
jgi:phosphoribosylformimino-5-aminoimidazole carboxamide ribotide isomerase